MVLLEMQVFWDVTRCRLAYRVCESTRPDITEDLNVLYTSVTTYLDKELKRSHVVLRYEVVEGMKCLFSMQLDMSINDENIAQLLIYVRFFFTAGI